MFASQANAKISPVIYYIVGNKTKDMEYSDTVLDGICGTANSFIAGSSGSYHEEKICRDGPGTKKTDKAGSSLPNQDGSVH